MGFIEPYKIGNTSVTPTLKSSCAPETDKDKDKDKDKSKSELPFPEDSDPFLLSSYLRKKILEANPAQKVPADTPQALEGWSKEAERMIRLDGHDPNLIATLIDWVTDDEFWRTNILSMAKLRKQFPRLLDQSGKLEKVKDHYREVNRGGRSPAAMAAKPD